MATSIVDTLFGVSPERLQQQRAAEADARALQFAQLDPFQQATFAIGRGASGLAGAIGGALGGQDPELQRVTMRQQIAGQINPSDPASIQQGIAALQQAGDAQGAMMLQSEFQKMQLGQSKIESEQALTTQRLRERESADPIQQLLRTGKFTPASIAQYQTSGEIGDLKSVDSALKTEVLETAQGQILINKNTGEIIANLPPAPDRRAVTNIKVGGTAENAYAKVAGKSTAERDIKIIEGAQSVADTLPKMYETRQLLETGALNTGFAAELQQVIDRAKTKILADKKVGKRVTDTEYLNSLLGSDVFPQISLLGIGARGLDTPAEREFLREVITGTISMDRETLKRMTDFRIRAAERAVENYNTKLEAGEFNQYQAVTQRPLTPIQTAPRAPASRQSAAPATPAYSDPEKEKRYQDFVRQQQGSQP